MEMRSVRVHASVSGSAVVGARAREGAEAQATRSVRAHGTLKVDPSGGDGGNRRGSGSADGQGEYEERGCTQEGGQSTHLRTGGEGHE